jgi:type II secretory pathway predicted ATPase ExeA
MVDDRDDRASLPPPAASQPFIPRMHRQALAELVRGIIAGEAFVALTGEPGVGKTTVLNAAIAALVERNFRVRRIGNPTRAPLHLQEMMGQLLVNPAATVTDEDIERLFDTITSNDDQDHLVIAFDDAQYLQADVLGYFQIASSLHALGIRQQQVIFTARPEFWNLLEDPKLRDLSERIEVRPVIDRLCAAEARDYLCRRIGQTFGARAPLIPEATLNAIIDHGEGLPGRLDLILTQSLAATRGGHQELHPDSVHSAAQAAAKLGSSAVLPMVAEGIPSQIVQPPPPSRISISKCPSERNASLLSRLREGT